MCSEEDIPIAYIEDVSPLEKKSKMHIATVSCPLCGGTHVHGVEPEVVKVGAKTHRGVHCKKGKPPYGYYVMMRDRQDSEVG